MQNNREHCLDRGPSLTAPFKHHRKLTLVKSYLGEKGRKKNQWCCAFTGDHTGLEQKLQLFTYKLFLEESLDIINREHLYV